MILLFVKCEQWSESQFETLSAEQRQYYLRCAIWRMYHWKQAVLNLYEESDTRQWAHIKDISTHLREDHPFLHLNC